MEKMGTVQPQLEDMKVYRRAHRILTEPLHSVKQVWVRTSRDRWRVMASNLTNFTLVSLQSSDSVVCFLGDHVDELNWLELERWRMRRISVGSEGMRRESNGRKDTAPAAGDGGPPAWWSPELILY